MSVTGIEKLEFGVEDLTHCAKFMRDFGLTGDASGQRFTTLSGARVELNPIDSPDLPPAFEAGNTLRRMTWAVASQSDLDALRPKLAQQPGYREVGDALECLDPNGMTLRVQVSQQTDVELNVEPINQWGDARRIDTPSPVYDRAQPINVGHGVLRGRAGGSGEILPRSARLPGLGPLYQPRRVPALRRARRPSQPVPAATAEPQARPQPCGLHRARHPRGDRRRYRDE